MDKLTQCWLREMERISLKAPNLATLWEEALVELTLALEPTMDKIHSGVPLGEYDRFLLDILRLLVLPGTDDDRELALQKLAEAAQRTLTPFSELAHHFQSERIGSEANTAAGCHNAP